MEEFNIDKENLARVTLIIGIIVCIFLIIGNIKEKNYFKCSVHLISIIVSVICFINIKEILKKIDPPDPICAGYLDYLNDLEDHKIKLLKEGGIKEIGETDEELRKAAMATHNEIIIIERAYTCACDGDDSNLPMEDRPSNKKSQWKNTKTNKIEEMTYKEYFTGMCDNNCKSENRPLTRCSTMDDCKFPGEICYQHPYLIENASERGVSPPPGICISNIQLFNLESMIDIYNSAFCKLDANGSTDYGCKNIMDGADASDFKNTKKDIINYTLASQDELICYSPFEEMKQISSYDEENQKYIIATSGGENCCIPYNASTNSVSQIDKITDFLKTHEKQLLEGIGMIFVQDLFQIFVEEGLKTGWDLAKLGVEGVEEGAGKAALKGLGRSLWEESLAGKGLRAGGKAIRSAPGEIGRTLLKGLLESRDLIVGSMKMALTGVKGMFEILMDAKKLSIAAVDLARVMVQLLSKIEEGAKILYELGKASLAAAKGAPAATKLAMKDLGAKALERAAERKAAAKATTKLIAKQIEEKGVAKVAGEAATMTAKAVSSAILDSIPGIGQILFAIQMIGMAMDEADTGGFQNVVKNSDVIDQQSEQLEGNMVWMQKMQLNKTPPFTIDMVNTFFPPDKKDEGSVWPFNIDLITGQDKIDAQNLIKLISSQKEATEKFTFKKLSEQIIKYTDTIKDPDIGKTIMIELNDHANNPDLSEKGKKDKIQDYFNECISSFLTYDLTKEECEQRDQDIYDTMINTSGFTDDEKKKYINNTGSKFYYNKDALIYFNKELSSPEYSGIICTPKAIDLYNRYRNLREGQQYIAYSEFYLDISHSENNKDYPNNLKHHMKKMNIKDSQTIKDLKLSPDNPIFKRNGMTNNKILGIPQYTMMNDIEAICLYGSMIGKPNYPRPGIRGMFMDGVSGRDLSKTWLQGGDNPSAKQPFADDGVCQGYDCCKDKCNENYNKDGLSDEQAQNRKDNYHNRIMSWNYADKSTWYGESKDLSPGDEAKERKMSPVAIYGRNTELLDPSGNDLKVASAVGGAVGAGLLVGAGMILGGIDKPNLPHAKVIDDDNRICIITNDYCQTEGQDLKHNRYGGESPLNEGSLNHFKLTYGNNNYREYDDCDPGYTHTAVSWILGDSMTDEIARWL